MELECTVDDYDVIVLDIGSGSIKAGYCGEDIPRTVVPTVCANKIDHAGTKTLLWGAEADLYGTELVPASLNTNNGNSGSHPSNGPAGQLGANPSGTTKPIPGAPGSGPPNDGTIPLPVPVEVQKIFPIQRGQLQRTAEHEECMEMLLENTLRSLSGGADEALIPLLLLDTPLNPLANREWMAQFLFETCRVPAIALFSTAVMSLFSTGRTRGLVVESGDGVTHAVPVFEGFPLPHAIFSINKAGRDITEELTKRVMAEEMVKDKPSSVTMQKMKEHLGTVADSREDAQNGSNDMEDEEARSFELPDGTIIQVPARVRKGACEILFHSEGEGHSVQDICSRALKTVDADFRNDLVKTVVVAGGSSMLKGFAPRLRRELSAIVPSELERHVNIVVDSQRRHAAWIGGSMFASLSTFQQMKITRAEYDEGKSELRALISRKTF